MLGIWHSTWYAEGAQQMLPDNDDDHNSISLPYPCRGVSKAPLLFFLSCFIRDL